MKGQKERHIMNKLKSFARGDGAHCGLTDWYPNGERAIRRALRKGWRHPWTTGWYSSKKEIACASITNDPAKRRIHVEVSVSDDFDTPGMGEELIPFRGRLKISGQVAYIRAALCRAWEDAEVDQRANALYRGFSIHEGNAWVLTYITPAGDGCHFDSPPGDNYHEWGWQDECEIPKKTKKVFEEWIHDLDGDGNEENASLTVGKYTIKPWRN